jgi:AcrR family transcriptional regulator
MNAITTINHQTLPECRIWKESAHMVKRTTITAHTKQNLIDAFWVLYCQKPLAQITVKEIVARAGYNRSTFYEYFTDVAAVLTAIEDALIPTIDTLPPFAGESYSIGMPIAQFMQLYQQNAKFYLVLLGENGDPAFASKLKNSIKPTILRLYQAHAEYDAVHRDFVVEFMLSALIGVMSYWFRQQQPLSQTQLLALMHQLMTKGVMPAATLPALSAPSDAR